MAFWVPHEICLNCLWHTGVGCQRFDITFCSDEMWNATIFFYVGTTKRGTQTKFLTFQCNFRENLMFRDVSLERNVKRNFFFTLDKRNVKRNNSVSLSFRTFDRWQAVASSHALATCQISNMAPKRIVFWVGLRKSHMLVI
jgi:hypothetical protein